MLCNHMKTIKVYEQGTQTPIAIMGNINLSLLDEELGSTANQGVSLFNQAITIANQEGFKFPYLAISSSASAEYPFNETVPYTPLPDRFLLGFVQTYMAYRLAVLETDSESEAPLSEGPDGWVALLKNISRERSNINPIYVRQDDRRFFYNSEY